MQIKYHWLLWVALLWSACQRADIPPNGSEDPVFTAQFEVGNQAETLTAGKEEVYLFTAFQADDLDVLVSTGTFALSDCPQADCPGSLTFAFRNDRTGALVFPDTLFALGSRSYYSQNLPVTDSIWRITFSTSDTLDYQLFQWNIDNNPVVNGKKVVKEYASNTPHFATLRAFRTGALGSLTSLTVAPEGSPNSFPRVGIAVQDSSQGGPYILTANTFGTAVESTRWSTGDSTTSIVESQLAASYTVKVENAAGDTAFAAILSITPITPITKTADINYVVESIAPQGDPVQLGTVAMRWIDANGVIWKSDNMTQDSDAFFQVLESEEYDRNENGQKTRKMRVVFSCKLYNDAGDNLPCVGSAIIAVAYP